MLAPTKATKKPPQRSEPRCKCKPLKRSGYSGHSRNKCMLFPLHSSLLSKRLHSLLKFLVLSSFNFPIRRQFSNAKIGLSNSYCISSAPTLNICHHYFLIHIYIFSRHYTSASIFSPSQCSTQALERAMSAAGFSDAGLNVNIRGGTHGRDASRWETQHASLGADLSTTVTATGGSMQQLQAAPVPEAGGGGSAGGGDLSAGGVTLSSSSSSSSSSSTSEVRFGMTPMNQAQRGRSARSSVAPTSVPKASIHHAEPADLLRFVKLALFHKHRVRNFHKGSKLDTWSHRIRVLGTHSSAPAPSAQNHSGPGGAGAGNSSSSGGGGDGHRNTAQRMRGLSSFASSSSSWASSSRSSYGGAMKGGAGAGSLREERDLDLPAFPNSQGG